MGPSCLESWLSRCRPACGVVAVSIPMVPLLPLVLRHLVRMKPCQPRLPHNRSHRRSRDMSMPPCLRRQLVSNRPPGSQQVLHLEPRTSLLRLCLRLPPRHPRRLPGEECPRRALGTPLAIRPEEPRVNSLPGQGNPEDLAPVKIHPPTREGPCRIRGLPGAKRVEVTPVASSA